MLSRRSETVRDKRIWRESEGIKVPEWDVVSNVARVVHSYVVVRQQFHRVVEVVTEM